MYLWTAIDASDALGEIRRRAEAENRDLALNEAAFTLPMHVSLKISFALAEEQAEAAVAEIAAFLGEQPPFPVQVEGLEQQGSLLWIRMQPSDRLRTTVWTPGWKRALACLSMPLISPFSSMPRSFWRRMCSASPACWSGCGTRPCPRHSPRSAT